MVSYVNQYFDDTPDGLGSWQHNLGNRIPLMMRIDASMLSYDINNVVADSLQFFFDENQIISAFREGT